MNGPVPSDISAAGQPLDPPPPGWRWARWLFILMGVNLMGLLWLAVREESGENVRVLLDSMVQIGMAAVIALAAFRALAAYPFRITDLFVMVIMLGMGIGVALEALHGISRTSLGMGRDLNPQSNLPLAVQWVLFTLSLLILGAALGLRYCQRLGLERPLERAGAVISGMLALPATAGVFAFPALMLLDLSISRNGVDDKGHSGRYLVLWVISLVCVAKNTVLLMRSLALQASVKDQSIEVKR